ncbi:MAG: SDR family oxidoreductase [bacterium]
MENTPLKRIAEPQELAKAILFLASEDASYITGEMLVVDGGYSLK